MLKTFELLDRFELLYADNKSLADLRRAYIDNDLHSIMRLTNANEDVRKAVIEKNLHSIFRLSGSGSFVGDLEDLRKAVLLQNLHALFRLLKNDELRKAVVEENLHSIFKFAYDDDLRKLVLEDNTWKLWPILARYTNTHFVDAFKSLYANEIDYEADCFSRGQLKSKLWLVEELSKLNVSLGTAYLCAGWYSTLATMLFESNIQLDKIRSFDIDDSCVIIAETMNKKWLLDEWKFKATTKDIHDIDFNMHSYVTKNSSGEEIEVVESPDTIINTSCEHIQNFNEWYNKIPKNKLIILQSNNYFEIEDHVNCSRSLEEFSETTPMSKVLFEGRLDLEKYSRYMKIGYK
jgi:hypothetical protein